MDKDPVHDNADQHHDMKEFMGSNYPRNHYWEACVLHRCTDSIGSGTVEEWLYLLDATTSVEIITGHRSDPSQGQVKRQPYPLRKTLEED